MTLRREQGFAHIHTHSTPRPNSSNIVASTLHILGQNQVMRLPEFRSPAGRAVLPVVGGIAFLGLLGLVLWGIAAVMSGEGAQTTTFTPDRLKVGSIRAWAVSIEDKGPVLFPGLGTSTGDRTLVLDHEGDNPERGWNLYYAYPADRDATCTIVQVPKTDEFTDCDGRTITVRDLALPTQGEFPVIEDRTTLYIDLGEPPTVPSN